jgi:hypothetical protein
MTAAVRPGKKRLVSMDSMSAKLIALIESDFVRNVRLVSSAATIVPLTSAPFLRAMTTLRPGSKATCEPKGDGLRDTWLVVVQAGHIKHTLKSATMSALDLGRMKDLRITMAPKGTSRH